MEILRTPDQRFKDLKSYPFAPHYTTIKTHDDSDLRIHHIDEGDKGNPVILCMHGQPVWSYLYARMISHFNEAGIRVIAPDLPGYGKSDKPAAMDDYTYQRQVDWMCQWLEKNNFSDLTFFAFMIGAKAAIAVPPQMAAPEMRRSKCFFSTFSNDPSKKPKTITVMTYREIKGK